MDDLLTRAKDELDRIPPAPHDPVRVERRARSLQRRRVVMSTAVALVVVLGVVVPLTALRHLGQAERAPAPAAGNDGDVWRGVDFPESEGWFVYRMDPTMRDITNAPAVWASNVLLADDQSADADGTLRSWSFPDLTSLPPEGVVIVASVSLATEVPPEPNVNFPAATLPLQLSSADIRLEYEGQQDPNVPEYVLWVTAGGYSMDVRTFFGTLHPNEEQLAKAQAELDQLIVQPRPDAIRFDPAPGWHVVTSDPRVTDLPGAPQAWASSTPFAEGDLPPGSWDTSFGNWPSWTEKQQGPNDLLIVVREPLETSNPFPDNPDFGALTLPIDLSALRVVRAPWEGEPSDDVSQIIARGVVNGRYLVLQVLFNTGTPSRELIARAQVEVNRLVVPPAPPPTLSLDQGGIRMNLPDGWQGRIFQYANGGALTLHASTRPIDDLYDAHTAWNGMGPDDLVVVLGEDTNATTAHFPQVAFPIVMTAADECVRGATVDQNPSFQDCEILDNGAEPPEGHTRLVRRFDVGERSFMLWVEFGTLDVSPEMLAEANDVLATLEIDPA
jgi:hypothetical protein